LSYLIPSFINEAFSEEDPVIEIVQDESRHILYTRSEKGSINIYDLGTDGQAMTRVAAINISSIVLSALSCQHCQNGGSILFLKAFDLHRSNWVDRVD
jgi:nuclear pore complex protein Nup155